MEKVECPRCLFDNTIASFKVKGLQCEYCDLHDELERQSSPSKLDPLIEKIKSKSGKYNCLIGISGGLDSSTLLWTAVKVWGLRPLVIHFDNHWNTPEAEHNIKSLVTKLNVDFIRYNVNKKEYDELCYAFLCAGVPDADIPNDIAMAKLMYETARKYGIKYILNGHDFRQEGSTPRGWTYMDAEYVRSVYKWYCGGELKNYPLFTFKDQIIQGLIGIKQVRPFYYMTNRNEMEAQMKADIGFQWYGGKHKENVYTEYVGFKLLPEKFGIDKRLVYYSAHVRSGTMSKQRAIHEMDQTGEPFDMEKLGKSAPMIQWTSNGIIRDRREFGRYNFKRYRPIIWILSKLGIVPYTFFKKYCFN